MHLAAAQGLDTDSLIIIVYKANYSILNNVILNSKPRYFHIFTFVIKCLNVKLTKLCL